MQLPDIGCNRVLGSHTNRLYLENLDNSKGKGNESECAGTAIAGYA